MGTHSCECCHRRKVRCDVNTNGSPCTNCRLDARPCEKRAPLKRGRKCRQEAEARRAAASRATNANRGAAVKPVPGTSDSIASDLAAAPQHIATSESQPALHYGEVPFRAHNLVPFYYHNFLRRPDIRHLRPEQIHQLENIGSLKVPSGHVLDEFIRDFFLYVHPCLPILHEASFWSAYTGKSENSSTKPGISLVLFQAMLFAASRFVSPAVISSCGLENPKHARALFHQRAEVLLLHEVERDPLILAQTSLLLSLQSTVADQSLNTTWLTRALRLARLAGANRWYEGNVSPAERLEKKKLWWACILRDRMIAIGVRRSIQITADEVDFDQGCLQADDFADEQAESRVYDPTTKKLLTYIVVAQSELAVAQTATLTTAYNNTDEKDAPGITSVSQTVTSMTRIESAKTELAVWARRFKAVLLFHTDRTGQDQDTNASVTIFAEMTLIHYYSTLVALYNYSISVLEKHQCHLADYKPRLNDLGVHLRNAIAEVAARVKRLSDLGLAHHLPISAPACTALPFVLEALDLRLSTSSHKDIHLKQVNGLSEVMRTFSSQHDLTECVTTAVDSILQVSELEIGHMLTAADIHVATTDIITAPTQPSSWSDMLISHPLVYLRLSLFLDLTLSQGKTPHVTDLPLWTISTANALQAHTASLSLHSTLPFTSQDTLRHSGRARVVEINDDEEDRAPQQWPSFEQPGDLMSPAPWSFVDMDIAGTWFQSV